MVVIMIVNSHELTEHSEVEAGLCGTKDSSFSSRLCKVERWV